MITTSINDEIGRGWLELLYALISGFLNRLLGRAARTSDSLTCEEKRALERAIRTIRMAANPGEDYHTVAARIEREAARYAAFLRNPQPIGKITLNIKQLDVGEDAFEPPHEQYHVYDPAEGYDDPGEGRASVSYTYNRSKDKVLEFFVHDRNDNQLFPIVRTYSNWLGSKEFDLGSGRTFHLNMVESAPGYVSVYAGFKPPTAEETHAQSPHAGDEEVRQRAARVEINAGHSRRWCFLPSPWRLVYLIGVECIMVSLISCSIFWKTLSTSDAFGNPVAATEERAHQTQTTAGPGEMIVQRAEEQSPAANLKESPVTAAAVEVSDTGGTERLVQASHQSPPKSRTETEEDGRWMKTPSCVEAENLCREFLRRAQREIEPELEGLKPAVSLTRGADARQYSFRLLVACGPAGWRSANLYFTLYPVKESLLAGKAGFAYLQNEQLRFFVIYSDNDFRKLVDELKRAKTNESPEMNENVALNTLAE